LNAVASLVFLKRKRGFFVLGEEDFTTEFREVHRVRGEETLRYTLA
jgi:hypothetical protein